MICGLFSVFDPVCTLPLLGEVGVNWSLSLGILLFLLWQAAPLPCGLELVTKKLLVSILSFVSSGYPLMVSVIVMFPSIIILVMGMNVSGLIPLCFAPSSHPLVILPLSMSDEALRAKNHRSSLLGSYFGVFVLSTALGSFLSLSSENWFSLWIGMEVSTFSFCAILISSQSGYLRWVSVWKYLVVQCVGSSLIFMAVVVFDPHSSPLLNLALLGGVSINIGLFPFHGWVIHVFENGAMHVLLILSTLQKIGPLVALFRVQEMWLLSVQISLSAVWAALSCVHLSSTKQFLGVSSVLMTAWLCAAAQGSWGDVVWFFLVYSFHLALLVFCLEPTTPSSIGSAYSSEGESVIWLGVNSVALAAQMGLPPFGVFIMNIEVFCSSIVGGTSIISCLLLLSSSVMVYGYLKIVFPLLVQNKSILIWVPWVVSLALSTALFPIFSLMCRGNFACEVRNFWFCEG